ncbi:stage II sporulation protein R [Peribacillus deserti]|uniref:Stage II sporulation protein R n=1 Tax=Peribacillus deserti TaxID=673318 RepID=A0ABS2QBW9_9BACI|nr:stage II sporulation protein R [Peribacillus deserti]MBM7690667.1 stage II sporulation protein R [Peribacillus deserti]
MKLLRKHIALVYLLLLVIGTVLSLYIPKMDSAQAKDTVIIPSDAIRLRILANSDKKEDQDLKRMVRDEVNKEITNWVKDLTSKEEARQVIEGNQKRIQEIAENLVKKQGVKQDVKVKFGPAKFPTKLYGQYMYPAGSYEAIVITLGDGEGANWWCVLYPPLCFLDFSNGTAVSQSPMEEEEPVEDHVVPADSDKLDGDQENEDLPVETKQPMQEKSTADTSENTAASHSENTTPQSPEHTAPVYTSKDEEPVKVKFLLVELFSDFFS